MFGGMTVAEFEFGIQLISSDDITGPFISLSLRNAKVRSRIEFSLGNKVMTLCKVIRVTPPNLVETRASDEIKSAGAVYADVTSLPKSVQSMADWLIDLKRLRQ